MKRSEMQYLLADFLSTIYETDKHPETQLARADMILTMLQESGLKPPLTKRCSVLLTNIHTWSEENENA
jgi:hypothetical protein